MSINRIAAKRDQNEPLIVSAFEARGWTVVRLSGKGLPDLLCMKRRTDVLDGPPPAYLLVDVKMPKGKFKPAQVETWDTWSSRGLPVYVATTAEDVQAIIAGAARPWGELIAAPKRGKALATVTADAGKRLSIAREPGKGRKRAPRPSYEQPRVEPGEGQAPASAGKDRRKPCGCLRSLGRCEHGPAYAPPTSTVQLAEETFAPGCDCVGERHTVACVQGQSEEDSEAHESGERPPIPPCEHCGDAYREKCFDPKAPRGAVKCRKDVHCYRFDGHSGDCEARSPLACTT